MHWVALSEIGYSLGLDVATVAVGSTLRAHLAGIDGDPKRSEKFCYVPLTRAFFPSQPNAPPSGKYRKISPAHIFFRATARGNSSFSVAAGLEK